MKVIIRKPDRIEYILSGIESYYDIDRTELLKKGRTPERYKRKSFAVKILRDIADCSFKDIKNIYGNSSENSAWVIHQKISDDIVFNNSVRKEYNNILTSMGL